MISRTHTPRLVEQIENQAQAFARETANALVIFTVQAQHEFGYSWALADEDRTQFVEFWTEAALKVCPLTRERRDAVLRRGPFAVSVAEWDAAYDALLTDVQRFTHKPRMTESNEDGLADFIGTTFKGAITPAAWAAQYDADDEGWSRGMTTAEAAYDLNLTEEQTRRKFQLGLIRAYKIKGAWDVDPAHVMNYAEKLFRAKTAVDNLLRP